jgi:hypothetical protein
MRGPGGGPGGPFGPGRGDILPGDGGGGFWPSIGELPVPDPGRV